MHLVSRLLLYLLLALGFARMVCYFVFAATMLPLPLEVHDLEAKFVLLAYRAEKGLSLYPAWWDYPYVSNWFGPVNSLVVGILGRWLGADIPGLFLIGRTVSLVSSIVTTLAVSVVVGRRYGQSAGLAAGVLSLGTVPMFAFTVMVRPDALAELLGVGGFLLSGSAVRGVRGTGVVLLILAVLTKQTAIVFLVAAALAATLGGERRRAVFLLLAGCAGLAVIVASVSVLGEPHFARSLVGERVMPWSYSTWRVVFGRVLRTAPELLILPATGLWIWIGDRSRPHDVRPATLSGTLLAAAFGLSAKVGADTNYYISLRVAEALAVGALWHAVHENARATTTRGPANHRSATLAAATLLAVVALVPAVFNAIGSVDLASRETAFYQTPNGRRFLHTYRDAIALARNPRVRLLTDTGILDLYQGERAAFGDPWLFHTLVETGQLRASAMAARIDSQYYDVFISPHDLESPGYVVHHSRLPEGLFERVRANYVLDRKPLGLLFYRRRDQPGAPRKRGARAAVDTPSRGG
jgi:hypothetical protein